MYTQHKTNSITIGARFLRYKHQWNTPEDIHYLLVFSIKLHLLVAGEKKLKNESFWTNFVTVRTRPRLLCFCFFFTVFNVTFFPLFQLMTHPRHLYISGPSNPNGSSSSGTHFISYSLVKTASVKCSLGSKWNSKVKLWKEIEVTAPFHITTMVTY